MNAIQSSPKLWRLVALVAVIVIIVVGAYLFFAVRSRAAQQPIAFNHQIMVGAGMPCLYCHTGVQKGPAAIIPSVQQCMGCHRVIATGHPEVQKLAGYWERQEPIPWARVYEVPRFVFFSHSVHIAAALNCEQCHGDVGNMVETYAVVDMNMGWCLRCHNQQPNAVELKDCLVCHR
jgi:c(7)-type cytochrome triheme protein